MLRRQELRVEYIGKNVWTAAGGQIVVKTLNVGQATPENDDLRVQQIDNPGQATPQALLVTTQAGFARCITVCRPVTDLIR